MTPRLTIFLALPVIAAAVLLLAYFRLFSSTLVIAVLVVLYVIVSIRNRRKFSKKNKAG